MDLRLSSGIIACARRVRERACAVDQPVEKLISGPQIRGLDPRTSCIYVFIRTQNTGFHGVVDNTQIRLDSSGCTRYALSPNFLRMRIPERCERGPARFEIRGAKKPYGRRRGESVKRKISLEPLFWYFVFLPISSTPGPVDFSSRIDREKAMCLS